MNSQLNILNPERERRIPKRFSWLDQRLVREKRIEGLSSDALALYLFLSCVADCRGMSFYSSSGINSRLRLNSLSSARSELIQADLLLYRSPYYQVLCLNPVPKPEAPPEKRSVSREEMAEIFAHLREGKKA